MPKDTFASITAPINEISAPRITNLLADAHEAESARFVLMYSSSGGDVGAALAVHNTLRASRMAVTTHNTGYVASAAGIVFLGGERRTSSPHTFFMFHPMTWDGPNADPDELDYRLDGVRANTDMYVELMTERTKLTEDDARGLLARPQRKSAEWALETGFIDAIERVEIPKTSRYVSWAFA